jgi:hypothetical protein
MVNAFIGRVMKAHSVKKRVCMILNKVGVCNSYQTSEQKMLRKLQKGLRCGYRRGGSAVGYDQYVFLFHLVEQLEPFLKVAAWYLKTTTYMWTGSAPQTPAGGEGTMEQRLARDASQTPASGEGTMEQRRAYELLLMVSVLWSGDSPVISFGLASK